jgi:DnaD/phage-associated family protein
MDHSFNPIFAQRYGMVAAVLIHDFAYWTAKNRANGKHMHDGLCWTYNSANAFQVQYPYMSRSQIYGALKKMLNDGLIVKGDYNTDKWVHTPWYAITDKGYAVISECAVESEKRCNRRDSENQTVERSETEQSSFENCDNDVEDFERGRSKNATTYTYTHNTILNSTNTDEHLSNPNGICEDDDEKSAGACEEEINPYVGDRIGEKGETVQKYALNNLRVMTPGHMQEFNEFMTVHGVSEELMKYAVDVACGNGAPVWNYVAQVLYGWLDAGVKSVGDAKAEQAKRKKKRDGQKPSAFGIDRRNNKIPEKYGGGIIV